MRTLFALLITCICGLAQLPPQDSTYKLPLFEDTFAVDYSYTIAPGAVELVTNGGFDSTTTGWVFVDSTGASIAGGQDGNCLELTRTANNVQVANSLSFSTVVGSKYRVVVWVKSGTSGDEACRIITKDSGYTSITILDATSSNIWVAYTLDFVAVTTTSNVSIRKNSATPGTMLFDTVSCKLLTGVNNTLSTGRGKAQTRTAVDTAGKAKTESGKLYLTGDGTLWTTELLTYPTFTRVPGINLLSSISGRATDTGPCVLLTGRSDGIFNFNNRIAGFPNGTIVYPLGFSELIECYTSRSTGSFSFLKISGAWTMMFPFYINTASMGVYIAHNGATTNSINFIRIPRQTFLPVPPLSDNFTGADGTAVGRISNGQGHPEANGGAGLVWQGGSGWQISGNTLINNPPLGDELLTDGGLENWGVTTNDLVSWREDKDGSTTITKTNDVRAGTTGTSAASFNIVNGAGYGIVQVGTIINNAFINISYWAKYSGIAYNLYTTTRFPKPTTYALTTSYAKYQTTERTEQTDFIIFRTGSVVDTQILVDDISVKQVAFTNLLLLANLPTPNVIMECKITAPSSQALAAGVALNFDSFSNPQNGTLVWLRNGNVVIQKIVGGTWTDLYDASTGFTYSAGAKLIVVSDNVAGEVRVFYNNALITSSTSTQDAGIKNNTYFGLFSGNLDQSIDDVVVWARGTGGEYSILDYLK